MDFIKTIQVGRCVERLKHSRTLTDDDVESIEARIVEAGPAAIAPMMKSLSHAEARTTALAILERLLDDTTLDDYIEALASPNPIIVSGTTKVLTSGRNFDPSRLLNGLSDPRLPKSNLEAILLEQASRMSGLGIVQLIPVVDKQARVVLFRLLERVADRRVVPDLLGMLGDEDWWVRQQAARLLANLDDDDGEVARGLVRLLHDDSHRVRLQAVTGLHKLGAKTAIPTLAGCLRDQDMKVQSAVIDALVAMGDASTVPHLLVVLTDESEHARRGAVEVLNAVVTPAAIEDLMRALQDADWWVRVRAADALGSLGGERVVEAVIALLHHSEEFLRRNAVEVLNAVPHEMAVDPLIAALQDSDWWVRERAIDALGNIADARAVEPLLVILKSDPKAEALCARALGRIGDGRALEALKGLLESDREDVQREATQAVARLSRGASAPNSSSDRRTRQMRVLSADMDRVQPGTAAPGAGAPRHVVDSPPSAVIGRAVVSTNASGERLTGTLNFVNLGPGTMIQDRYRIVRRIATGGFGTVYLVEDSAIHEELILKILNPQLSVDDKELQRFVQELKLTRRLSSKNIIRIFDFMDLGGVHAISMEYFPGRDLGQVLSDEGKLSPLRALQMAMQICEGLAVAHDENVVHRDIKPPNILVGANDVIKIVDFGLALAQQWVGSRLTKSGLLIGSPEYMAPELIRGDSEDHRVDIYSLGIVMYEVLTGRKPYAADSVVKVLFQHLEGEVEPLRTLLPEISPGLEAIVMRSMSRDAADRPSSVRELQAMVSAELALMPTTGVDGHA